MTLNYFYPLKTKKLSVFIIFNLSVGSKRIEVVSPITITNICLHVLIEGSKCIYKNKHIETDVSIRPHPFHI